MVAISDSIAVQEAALVALNILVKEIKEELSFVKEQDAALSKVKQSDACMMEY